MFYDEEIVRALRRKFAPDIMTALRDADAMELHSPGTGVDVPLVAGVTVFHEKNLGAFIVRSAGGRGLFFTPPRGWQG